MSKSGAKTGQSADEPVATETADSPAEVLEKPVTKALSTMILADIALRGGSELLRRTVGGKLLGHAVSKTEKVIKGRSLGQTLVGTAIARLATRSVPGAILVGGGLLAKTLYDRKQASKRSGNKGGGKKDGKKAD